MSPTTRSPTSAKDHPLDEHARNLHITAISRTFDTHLLHSIFPQAAVLVAKKGTVILKFESATEAFTASQLLEMTTELAGARFSLLGDEHREIISGGEERRSKKMEIVEDTIDGVDEPGSKPEGADGEEGTTDKNDTADSAVDGDGDTTMNTTPSVAKGLDETIKYFDTPYYMSKSDAAIHVDKDTQAARDLEKWTGVSQAADKLRADKPLFQKTRTEQENALYGEKLQKRQKEFEARGLKGLVGLSRRKS